MFMSQVNKVNSYQMTYPAAAYQILMDCQPSQFTAYVIPFLGDTFFIVTPVSALLSLA